jgi:hypothetical protein
VTHDERRALWWTIIAFGVMVAVSAMPTTAHAHSKPSTIREFRAALAHVGESRREIDAACWIVSRENGRWQANRWGGSGHRFYGLGQMRAGGRGRPGGCWKGWWWRNRRRVDVQALRMRRYAHGRYGSFVAAKRAWKRKGWW